MKAPFSASKAPAPAAGRIARAAPFVLCCIFLFLSVWDALVNSGACDELGAHIPGGYLYLISGKFSGGVNNFPLGQIIIALPVRLLGLSYELFTEQHLFLFRLPGILMGLLLAAVVYRFACGLFARRAGLAALFLYVLSPNILAHASLATLDLPIAFLIFLTLYLLWRYTRRPDAVRLVAFSLALACALAVKVQAILLLPIVVIILGVCAKDIARRGIRGRVRLFLSWPLIPLISWMLINAVYLNNPLVTAHLLPSQFLGALEVKVLHSEGGHFGYLMGQYSTGGWWYYFPAAILMKTPLPTLVLLAIGLCRKPSRESVLFVFLPLAVFLGMAMRSKVNIGLRHVLMIYPFIFILAGRGAASLWSTPRRAVALAVLAVLYVSGSVIVAPHHLSYFNVLSGGAAGGHRLLIDSNYDWGINDRFLQRYVQRRGVSYEINPDAFTPVTGHILVSANALYGVINGGPAAYAWLKETSEPVNRIAYTWFEYDIPGDRIPHAERERPIRDHLRGLLRLYGSIREPRFRQALAGAMAGAADYGNAFHLLRLNLREHPAFAPSLSLGGELIVRWKLGVLRFKGDQYLSGFEVEQQPGEAYPVPDEMLIRMAEDLRMRTQLADVHYNLGDALYRRGASGDAASAFRLALLMDPTYHAAANYLAWILATSHDDSQRDGEEAVRLAERLCADIGWDQPRVLDTLAAAYAEAGRFDDAVRTSKRAVELMVRDGTAEGAATSRGRLALYRLKRQYRQSMRTGDGSR